MTRRQYQAQLERYVGEILPQSDSDVARLLLANLDRPAFRTRFHQESSLPRFREAIAETIASINLGTAPGGKQLPSKSNIGDPLIRDRLDAVVAALVSLRATFDSLVRSNDIRPCGCKDPACPVFELSPAATQEMDRKRADLLKIARQVAPTLPADFYE